MKTIRVIKSLRRAGRTWWQVAYFFTPPWYWLRAFVGKRAGFWVERRRVS